MFFWIKSLDAVVEEGSVRATGLCCTDVHKIDSILCRCQSTLPQVLQVSYGKWRAKCTFWSDYFYLIPLILSKKAWLKNFVQVVILLTQLFKVATAQGKQGIWFLLFFRQGKHREFCCNTGKVFETQRKYFWLYLLMQKAWFSFHIFKNF